MINLPERRQETPSPEREEGFSREEKEKEAWQAVLEKFKEKLERKQELLREKPRFFAKGKTWEIKDSLDLVRAEAQVLIRLAQELTDELTERGDYWEAKMAQKLVELVQKREEFLARLIELKAYHPEAYGTLEGMISGIELEEIEAANQKLFEELNKEKTEDNEQTSDTT